MGCTKELVEILMSRWQNRDRKRKSRKPKFKKQYRDGKDRAKAKAQQLKKLRRDKDRRKGIEW